jgi:hypothetical protein
MNDYDAYDDYHHGGVDLQQDDDDDDEQQLPNTTAGAASMILDGGGAAAQQLLQPDVDFDDPAVAALPRVLLMGPRRGGKTSIQVRKRVLLLLV